MWNPRDVFSGIFESIRKLIARGCAKAGAVADDQCLDPLRGIVPAKALKKESFNGLF